MDDDSWKYDKIPELLDGKNVADFIDPDIEAKLDALEQEEERLIAEGFYVSDNEMLDEEELQVKAAADEIREKKKIMLKQHNLNKTRMRMAGTRTTRDMELDLNKKGKSADMESIRSRSRVGRKRERSVAPKENLLKRARSNSQMRDRSTIGLREGQGAKAERMRNKSQTRSNLQAKAGEGDRSIQTKMPKHLFAGKRGLKADRR